MAKFVPVDRREGTQVLKMVNYQGKKAALLDFHIYQPVPYKQKLHMFMPMAIM